MLAARTGSGLSAAAGLNAFIPFVVIGVLLIRAVVQFRLYRLRRRRRLLRRRATTAQAGGAVSPLIPSRHGYDSST